MTRFVKAVAAMGVAASVLWSSGALAHLAPGPDASKQVHGRVVAIEQTRNMVTMLKLDNGVTLVLPGSSETAGMPVKAGDEVVANYVDNGGENLVTFLRVLEVPAP